MNHALIVEDDRDSAEMMAKLIAEEGFTVATAYNLRDARRELSADDPDVVMLDLVLPDGSGMELFEDKQLLGRSEVVFITGHASIESSVQALRLGAADYLIKPISVKQVRNLLSRLKRPSLMNAEIRAWQAQVEEDGHFGSLWGRSLPMQRVYEQIAKVAATSVTALVIGESGTGKELVAETIHRLGRRRDQPFLAINCGAISPQLIESEIFGHEKGSFTGAVREHSGVFERASGGTLFLDEITEMPLELQVKLLRVLETGTFMKVGSGVIQETDVRVIAATNRNPEEAVASRKLRDDLFYRLNVFPINMPPLRTRADDIPLLAEKFLTEICAKEGQEKRFAAEAFPRMASYHWPGNVRELRNAVQRAFVMASGSVISDEWLPLSASAAPAQAEDHDTIPVQPGIPLAAMERSLILATLKHFNGHKEKTAVALGMSLKTLYNRLKEYGSASARRDDDPA